MIEFYEWRDQVYVNHNNDTIFKFMRGSNSWAVHLFLSQPSLFLSQSEFKKVYDKLDELNQPTEAET